MKTSRITIRDHSHAPDWPFLFLVLILLLIGVVMVYDSSVVTASNVFGGKYHFLIQQLFWVLFGMSGFFFFANTNYHKLNRHSKALLFAALLLLFFVILPLPFAPVINGARRWLILNPSPLPSIPFFNRLGFQPTELAKLILIIYFSKLFTDKPRNYLVVFLGILLTVLTLIAIEPDFGTAMITAILSLVLLFVSGIPLLFFGAAIPIASILGLGYVLSSAYRRARLMTFLSPDSSNLQTSGYHVQQILIALGSGGFSGLGLGQSRQKYGFIPEVQTDSIFAIVGEEFGLVGTVLLILLLFLLIWRGFKIASNCSDRFSKYLAVGFTSWFAIQVIINLAAMTHLIPLTGVPLPLISYGGSAMIFMLSGLGVVFNVSKYTKKS